MTLEISIKLYNKKQNCTEFSQKTEHFTLQFSDTKHTISQTINNGNTVKHLQ